MSVETATVSMSAVLCQACVFMASSSIPKMAGRKGCQLLVAELASGIFDVKIAALLRVRIFMKDSPFDRMEVEIFYE